LKNGLPEPGISITFSGSASKPAGLRARNAAAFSFGGCNSAATSISTIAFFSCRTKLTENKAAYAGTAQFA